MTPAERAARASRMSASAGWVAMFGLLLMAAGILARVALLPAPFAVLIPAGMLVAVAAAGVFSLGQQLADRYRQEAEVER